MTIVIEGLALKRDDSPLMVGVHDARLSVESGLAGSVPVDNRDRQVTVLSQEQWKEVCRLGFELPWTTRRANVLVAGITFGSETVGRFLCFKEVVLEVTEETKPCSRMDQARPGLREALSENWRGGVACRVVRGGSLVVGEEGTITDALDG